MMNLFKYHDNPESLRLHDHFMAEKSQWMLEDIPNTWVDDPFYQKPLSFTDKLTGLYINWWSTLDDEMPDNDDPDIDYAEYYGPFSEYPHRNASVVGTGAQVMDFIDKYFGGNIKVTPVKKGRNK